MSARRQVGTNSARHPNPTDLSQSSPTALGSVGVAPGTPRVLIVNQASPSYPVVSDRTGRQTQMLLRHFTPHTTLTGEADYKAGSLAEFDRVVIIGNDALVPLPSALLEDLAQWNGPLLWLGYGLEQLPVDMDLRFGFLPQYSTDEDLPNTVTYRGKHYPALPEAYTWIIVTLPSAEILATYEGGSEPIPYVIRGGNLWYVNGRPNLDSPYPDEATDAPTLVFADILHDFFETGIAEARRSVIRLEDVSVHVDPASVVGATDTLRQEGFPFVLGLIPNQRLEDGSVASLRERPEFVDAVDYATKNGATIALHGYHHTFGSGEDFEFWDEARNAPIAGETWEMYAAKVEDGIRILRDLDLEPRLWETPHYAASSLAYQVFAHYFSHAIENREPASWLPYPIAPDEYGQTLIPENIGYINPEEGWTVDAQLHRARLLKIVRDAWAVGFYHPASIPLSELGAMALGLKGLGYSPVDVGRLPLEVRDDYKPVNQSPLTQLTDEMGNNLGWLSTLRSTLWGTLLFVGFMLLFVVRLRHQWQPETVSAVSLLETTERRSWPGLLGLKMPRRALVPALATLLLLIVGAWAMNRSDEFRAGPSSSNRGDPGTARISRAAPAVSPEFPTLAVSAASSRTNGTTWEPSGGWELSIYYTAVESFHTGPLEQVRGCAEIECSSGTVLLGNYPQDFVQAVKDEGTGRITSGDHAGKYLNWSIDIGYWLDTHPRDARGLVLRPYLSAAVDVGIPYVTPLKILECGIDMSNQTHIDQAVCDEIRAVTWVVRDRFTVGEVGKHIDLYIGEEDRPNFVEDSPRAIHTRSASVSIGPSPLGTVGRDPSMRCMGWNRLKPSCSL
jgi:hypothetical protein